MTGGPAARFPEQANVVVTGLGFGDEGKGATVDWLCSTRPVAAVVRCNGGAQAAHTVREPGVDGRPGRRHTFHQFGSGTFAGVPTYLAEGVTVEPIALAAEAEALAGLGVSDPLRMLTVHPDALVTTPVHVAANRTREDRRGRRAHGSCGLGVGETVWYDLAARAGAQAGQRVGDLDAPGDVTGPALRVGDCRDRSTLRRRLEDLIAVYRPLLAGSEHGHPGVDEMVELASAFAEAVRVAEPGHLARVGRRGPVVVEQAQGVLLDQWRGFHPHTTWSTTTPDSGQAVLAAAGLAPGAVVGVVRGYATRHGAGPLPTEDGDLLDHLPEPDNDTGRYQGAWRVGHLDLVGLRYALRVAGRVDGLAVTHLDSVVGTAGRVRVAVAHRVGGTRVTDWAVGRSGDLDHQAGLTAQLTAAEPELVTMDGADDVLRHLAALGVPVVATATGPTRADRAACAVLAGR
ncbi:adenylosuccinate synthetase [Nakamurella leprariae]|uniref:Adenylosuccinate synthetase n=1 Tax=Nakamurella leprariae TaxID=2803911 RepID=A0A938YF87_9ACTN|nr:adenylosuccinate synthetase [Nakamurella leprariae]MBM9467069.1 adenylosuccinate synthetase [Nakamurella leprariae]